MKNFLAAMSFLGAVALVAGVTAVVIIYAVVPSAFSGGVDGTAPLAKVAASLLLAGIGLWGGSSLALVLIKIAGESRERKISHLEWKP